MNRSRTLQTVCLIPLVCVIGLAVSSGEESGDIAAPIRPFLGEYCARCHGEEKLEGDVDLTGILSERDLLVHRDLWESVIEQIDTEEMPTKEPFPSEAERGHAVSWLRRKLDSVDWSDHRSPGRVTLPRLTRDEYRNTLRDLLGVDLRAGEELPEDGEGESGFTNDRDSLSLTASQLEHFFASAERAIDGVFALAKPPMSFRIEGEAMGRSPEKLKPHEHGVVIVHPDHELSVEIEFPADGWYRFQADAAVLGGKPCVADFRINGELTASARVMSEDFNTAPAVEATGFVRAGRHVLTIQSRNLVPQTPEPPDIVRTIDRIAKKNAARLAPLSGSESDAVREAREGLNTKAWGIQESIEWLRFLGPEGDPRKIDLRRVYLAEREADWRKIRSHLAAAAGIPAQEIDRLWREQNASRLADNGGVLKSVAGVEWGDWMRYQGKLFVDRFEVAGPVRPESASAWRGWTLLDALTAPDAHPETLVRQFLPLAFRRPVEETQVERYLDLLRTIQRREEMREDALSIVLAAILTSPRFLYRDELPVREGEEGNRPIDDWALASRLSYFLWQSMPDAELFDLAESGLLSEPETLADQAERMLGDQRASAFFGNFADDWLGLRRLGRGIAPDPTRFPGFSLELAEAMKVEAHELVGWFFREDRPVTDLIDSPIAFLNQPLAEHYGIAGVKGAEFRPVALADERRSGVLGLGGVLVATSSPARTNPVRRGAWVYERLLGKDPGEALPTAGELPGNAGEARGLTLREELDLHRSKAECARCHDKIDPLGFGLQNFDATGRWREREAGRPVDASGQMPSGTKFSGPEGLKQVIQEEHRIDVNRNLVRRLLSFALGRELAYFDMPLVSEIVAGLDEAEGSSHRLVRLIVQSEAFRFQADTKDLSKEKK